MLRSILSKPALFAQATYVMSAPNTSQFTEQYETYAGQVGRSLQAALLARERAAEAVAIEFASLSSGASSSSGGSGQAPGWATAFPGFGAFGQTLAALLRLRGVAIMPLVSAAAEDELAAAAAHYNNNSNNNNNNNGWRCADSRSASQPLSSHQAATLARAPYVNNP